MAETVTYTVKILPALSKVFLDEEPRCDPACARFTALQGEVFSFVAAYAHSDWLSPFARVRIESPIADCCHIRDILHVPVAQPTRAWTDDNYLRTAPGLYPDLLAELEEGRVLFSARRWKSLWVDVDIPPGGPAGTFPIDVVFEDPDGRVLCRGHAELTVYGVVLGAQKLLRSEWFHGDCLADYYAVPVFSEAHWRILENFIRAAARRGCNTLLTPQFTPPLDTAKGGDRTTIQLVDVHILPGGGYTFGFDKLKRWVEMCLRAGITHFEMSHLFTQWGACAAPKIMAEREGALVRLFGWDTDPTGAEYAAFLAAYLPSLTAALRAWGVAGVTRFHVSDEPEPDQLPRYRAALALVRPWLEGFPIMDAMSDLSLFQAAGLDCPVCANDHIQPFLDAGVRPLWSYYCTAQFRDVSNRFMSMPSARCRIYGMQVFRAGLEGVLHWGYNFYNSKHSVFRLDPYRCTDAGGVFPSGDPFLVYPGPGGEPEESIRMMVLCHAMQDVRALEQLAALKGRDFALAVLDEGLTEPITFSRYPKSDLWLLEKRNQINALLAAELCRMN